MLATGIILYVPTILLPLVAAIVLFARRGFRSEIFILLLLISCLLFTRFLLTGLISPRWFPETTIEVYFNLAEWLLAALLYRSITHAANRQTFTYLLIATLSSAITVTIILPVSTYFFTLKIIHAAVMVVASLYCLFVLIRNRFLFLFQHPLFWMAGGTWFFYSMVIVVEWLQKHRYINNNPDLLQPGEKEVLLGVFLTVRLFFYLLASLSKEPRHQEEEWKNLKESSREFLP